MPEKLFKEVKNDIPLHVGVLANGNWYIKKAKKQELKVDEQVLKDSLIRSLAREEQKLYQSDNPHFVNNVKRIITELEKELSDWKNKYYKLMKIGIKKYGYYWYREEN